MEKILQIVLAINNHKMKVHFACNIGTDLLSTKSPYIIWQTLRKKPVITMIV